MIDVKKTSPAAAKNFLIDALHEYFTKHDTQTYDWLVDPNTAPCVEGFYEEGKTERDVFNFWFNRGCKVARGKHGINVSIESPGAIAAEKPVVAFINALTSEKYNTITARVTNTYAGQCEAERREARQNDDGIPTLRVAFK